MSEDELFVRHKDAGCSGEKEHKVYDPYEFTRSCVAREKEDIA